MSTNSLNRERVNYTGLNFSGNTSRKSSSVTPDADVWLWNDGGEMLWSDNKVIPIEGTNTLLLTDTTNVLLND